jgi:hypothetical protein
MHVCVCVPKAKSKRRTGWAPVHSLVLAQPAICLFNPLGVWAPSSITDAAGPLPPKPKGAKGSSGGRPSSASRRKTTRREAMMGTALDLFVSMLAADDKAGLAPDSWCFTSVVDALVRGGRCV